MCSFLRGLQERIALSAEDFSTTEEKNVQEYNRVLGMPLRPPVRRHRRDRIQRYRHMEAGSDINQNIFSPKFYDYFLSMYVQ